MVVISTSTCLVALFMFLDYLQARCAPSNFVRFVDRGFSSYILYSKPFLFFQKTLSTKMNQMSIALLTIVTYCLFRTEAFYLTEDDHHGVDPHYREILDLDSEDNAGKSREKLRHMIHL